jgi:cyclohexyl-isocyanide hydratase
MPKRRSNAWPWRAGVFSPTLLATSLSGSPLPISVRAASSLSVSTKLPAFGAIPVAERVVRDRNRISGGGVTAGIDFGLTVAAELAGEEVAKSIQLVLEYDPQPPFDSGSPEKAGEERVKRIRERLSGLLQVRQSANDAAAARLG